ncbi:MAG TPA: hypothetical protein DER23_08015 [Clostridiales bacterium]|jgi:alcohol dehydrogenase class IV|nr:hypothetical protein [Clostridiales bacterium]
MNKEKLQYLLNMDEKELQTRLTEIMRAMKVEDKKINKMIQNLPRLKESVGAMSDEQIKAFSSQLSEDNLKMITKAIEDAAHGGKHG